MNEYESRKKVKPIYVETPCAGAGEGTRTLNLRITNPMLYQLSYASLKKARADYRPGSSPLASA